MKEQDPQLNFSFYQFIALTTTSLTLGDRVSSLDLTLSSNVMLSCGLFSSQQLTRNSVASSMSCFHCFIILFTPLVFFLEEIMKKKSMKILKKEDKSKYLGLNYMQNFSFFLLFFLFFPHDEII